MNIDIAKSGQENILDLILASNPGLEMQASQIQIGAVSDFTGGTKPGLNTQLTVTANLDMGFSGTRVVMYRRLSVGEVNGYADEEILIAPGDSQAAIKTKIAAFLKVREADIELDGVAEEPTSENNPTTIGVRGVEGSYLYSGEVVEVILTVPDTDIALEDAIAVFELDGFDPLA